MDDFSILPCPAERRPDGLRALHAGLPTDQQLALVQTLNAVRDQSDAVFDGLIVAIDQGQVIAAVWAQLTPGKTAVMWLPDGNSSAAVPLLQAAAKFLDEREVTLAQFLSADEHPFSTDVLAAADFRELAKLAYLSVDPSTSPHERTDSELEFVARASDDPARLGQLLLRTYEESLDCPQLNGLRDADDVLEGYREQGEFSPERWFIVRSNKQDIGTLILTVHSDTGNWELVYMGLIPEQRGQGFGKQVLDFAVWKAGQGGAERLVLAVDQHNQPALDTYQRAGFVAWDHRTVYARLRPSNERLNASTT